MGTIFLREARLSPQHFEIECKCIFHSFTGLDCPGCGSQRAASALLHGKFLQAIDYNILFVFLVPFVIYSAFVFTWNVFSNKKIRQNIFYSVDAGSYFAGRQVLEPTSSDGRW